MLFNWLSHEIKIAIFNWVFFKAKKAEKGENSPVGASVVDVKVSLHDFAPSGECNIHLLTKTTNI